VGVAALGPHAAVIGIEAQVDHELAQGVTQLKAAALGLDGFGRLV
jgi:hypothetical protein